MESADFNNKVDTLWTSFWTGGITNPLTVIEQITYLIFSRMLDIAETLNERRAQNTDRDIDRVFGPDQQQIRWSNFRQLGPDDMMRVVRDDVFPHFGALGNTQIGSGGQPTFSQYFSDAQLMIQKPALLVEAVELINNLPLTGDKKGDIYEYLLSKLTTAGINGQFRTPRHIIRLMVEMVDPKPTETICDPACGTGGFLVGAMMYLEKTYSDEAGIYARELEENLNHIQNDMFYGFDFDVTMLRIAAMNMLVHNITTPDIHYQDTLAANFKDKFTSASEDTFDLVLANPPFKGALDYDAVSPDLLRKTKTKKTELLFVSLILRLLKNGGRCAMIVPDGVLFGASKAHQTVRRTLLEENQLEAVVSLPTGVFKPYAGVSTAVLVFIKGGSTENVFFYDLEDDGFTLDDHRRQKYDSDFAGDLPDLLEKWGGRATEALEDRKKKAFFVPCGEIVEKGYDLSINRYKKIVDEIPEYDPPKMILERLKKLQTEIVKGREKLEEMLR